MDPGYERQMFEAGQCTCNVISQYGKPLERRKVRHEKRCRTHSVVGTPNYIAPEVLSAGHAKRGHSQVGLLLSDQKEVEFNCDFHAGL